MSDTPNHPTSPDNEVSPDQEHGDEQLHRREFIATFFVLGALSLILVLSRLFFHP